MINGTDTVAQFLKYVLVGLMSNLAAFLLYLGLSSLKLHYVAALTIVYFVALILSFAANREWTFKSTKPGNRGRRTLLKYLCCYGLAFALNALALLVLVESYGFRHEMIQAILIPSIAVCLFMMQKYWVFISD